MKKLSLGMLFLIGYALNLSGQNESKSYEIHTIAFYNLENLFDTINDPEKDDELSPIMKFKGNKSKVYSEKINRMAFAISKIGSKKNTIPPTIIGVAEVENRTVLENLVRSRYLKNFNYGIVHYDSPDKRGIDVALLFNQTYFQPIYHKVIPPNIYRNNRKISTRDILYVVGYLDNELIHILVNHWPSRSGGEFKTRASREKAAFTNLRQVQKIQELYPTAKIIVMGDLNDNPTNSSLKEVLHTKRKKSKTKTTNLYNPFESMFLKGMYSLGHRNSINLFDMILISGALIPESSSDLKRFKFFQAGVFSESFLTTQKGRFKGFPFRSYSNGNFTGGYSDHFPVHMYLIKEKQ